MQQQTFSQIYKSEKKSVVCNFYSGRMFVYFCNDFADLQLKSRAKSTVDSAYVHVNVENIDTVNNTTFKSTVALASITYLCSYCLWEELVCR